MIQSIFRAALLAAVVSGVTLIVAVPSLSLAQTAAPQATNAELAEGEIRRIDREGRRLTLRHGVIKTLEMPPMTMVFQLREPLALDGLEVGTKVRFAVVNEGGKYIITFLEAVK